MKLFSVILFSAACLAAGPASWVSRTDDYRKELLDGVITNSPAEKDQAEQLAECFSKTLTPLMDKHSCKEAESGQIDHAVVLCLTNPAFKNDTKNVIRNCFAALK